ncbi:hypothetical protein [Bacillus massiliigorillae]|uniref:hypothetical protein n=1 Tax=Bacillus massiliigorillae TaxID=1243664 RepID=UPI00039C81AC|nr:hypothetical protein [Bacillus massiliigorillae]
MIRGLRLALAFLLVFSLVTPSLANAEQRTAPDGFYDVTSLSYKSVGEFQASSNKASFFIGNWYLLIGGQVIKASDVVTLTDAQLASRIMTLAQFEASKQVSISSTGEIKKVDGNSSPSVIEHAGTYGGTQDAPHVYDGDVTVKAADVTLKNAIIKGDLTIASSVGEGNVHFDNIKVEGQTYVKGGGENSIHFNDSTLVTIIVNKNNGSVRVVAQGQTRVDEVKIESPTILFEENLTGDFDGFTNVFLSEALQNTSGNVTLEGRFDTVNSIATNVRINLPANSSIDSLALSAIASVLGEGAIRLLEASGSSAGSSIETKPQNVVLDINGRDITVGGESITEGYTGTSSTTLQSIAVSPSYIAVHLEDPLTNLTANDFDVKATIDGEIIQLDDLQYVPTYRMFFFKPIKITSSNIGKTVTVTVTPKPVSIDGTNVTRVIGHSVQGSFKVATGFSGRITDIYGKGISNLRLSFTSNSDQADAVTDANGYYFVYTAPGVYNGTIKGSGYVDTPITTAVASSTFETQQNGTIIRAAASSEWKIMLEWNGLESDVDSHFTGPGNNGDGFHVYYANRDYSEGNIELVDLDWDDVDYYGPETTTVRQWKDGRYVFYVHRFSRDTALSNSEATVKIFKGNATHPEFTFKVPQNSGDRTIWGVFELEVSNGGEQFDLKTLDMFGSKAMWFTKPKESVEYYIEFMNSLLVNPATSLNARAKLPAIIAEAEAARSLTKTTDIVESLQKVFDQLTELGYFYRDDYEWGYLDTNRDYYSELN